MIFSWALIFVTGLLFLSFILYYTLSGTYGKEVVKAKLTGKKLVWVIDNHNDVRPYAVGGESGNKVKKMGTFLPDPENSVKTEDVKGSLYDSNVAPAVSFNLLTAVKKLARFDVKRGRANKNGMDNAIREQLSKSESATEEIQNGILCNFESNAIAVNDSVFNEKMNEFINYVQQIEQSVDNSEIPEQLKSDIFKFLKSEFSNSVHDIENYKKSEEYQKSLETAMISVINDYSDEISNLSNEFKNEVKLSDSEIKALRNYFALVQPQYVERKVIEGVNEATAGQKDLTKVFIYVCGGVGIIVLAIAFFVMLTGGNDPTIIVQNASDIVANNTTQIPL